jgi:hypothetical protein
MGRALSGAVVLLSFILTGCGWWEGKVAFPGPSQGTVLEIEQPFPANGWGIRIVLRTKNVTKALYQIRGDVVLNFADVAWAKDEGVVAVFTCGTPAVRLAYSVANGNELPFAQMQPMVAAHIRAGYHLDRKTATEKDTFEWACSSDGRAAFLRAHPGASPR